MVLTPEPRFRRLCKDLCCRMIHGHYVAVTKVSDERQRGEIDAVDFGAKKPMPGRSHPNSQVCAG